MRKIKRILVLAACTLVGMAASAQTGAPGDAIGHTLGSRHLFKVNANVVAPGEYTHKSAEHGGNTYTWTVFTADASGVKGTAATEGTEFDFKEYNGSTLNLSTDAATGSDVDLFAIGIQWNVPGDYLVQVTEQNKGTGACTTLRNIHINVAASTPNLLVLSTDAGGTELTGNALNGCSMFSGILVDRGTAIADEANKPAYVTERYYTLTMNAGGNQWHGKWGLSYTASATNTDGDAAIQNIVVSSANAADVTIDTGAKTIVVTGDNPVITLKVTVNNTPGPNANKDITLAFTADSTSPYIEVAGSKTMEIAGDDINNSAANYLIYAAPATEDITID